MESNKDKSQHLDIGVMNGDVASDFYKEAPCTIGYSYARFEVTGDVKGCCISKYALGNVAQEGWQQIWNNRRYEAFREKMKTIQDSHFHLKDPDWGFCQQCSHRVENINNNELLQTPYEDEIEEATENSAPRPVVLK